MASRDVPTHSHRTSLHTANVTPVPGTAATVVAFIAPWLVRILLRKLDALHGPHRAHVLLGLRRCTQAK